MVFLELVGPLVRLEEGKRDGGRRRGSLGVEAVPVVHVWEDGLDGVELVCGGLIWGEKVERILPATQKSAKVT